MFQNMKIGKKLSITVLLVSLAALIAGFLILNWYSVKIEDEVDKKFVTGLQLETNEKFQLKKDVGISNAVSVANDGKIKQALEENDREIAIQSLKNLGKRDRKSVV